MLYNINIILGSLLFSAYLFAGPAILLTGGTGYIGSHVAVELLKRDYNVVLTDHLTTQRPLVKAGIEAASGKQLAGVYPIEMLSIGDIRDIFEKHHIDAVIHLAGYKSVSESVEHPVRYYENNLVSTLNLLKVMKARGCNRLVFSSSATVYGAPQYLPIDENHPVSPSNPYGQTKLMIEQILTDEVKSNSYFKPISLRYFNPIGAHESGYIGETPKGIPANIFPYILDVAQGRRAHVNVFGNDYATKDGTAVRDYIHVVDLAQAHVKALEQIFKAETVPSHETYNIGTGQGYTVLELINAVSKETGTAIPYKFTSRRPGDIEHVVASSEKARAELGFSANRSLAEMVRDGIRFINRVAISNDF